MRKEMLLNQDWTFIYHDGTAQKVNIPHTWNALDGQDGGDDYFRGSCIYKKTFSCPDFDRETQRIYLDFAGVNASARVVLNGAVITKPIADTTMSVTRFKNNCSACNPSFLERRSGVSNIFIYSELRLMISEIFGLV